MRALLLYSLLLFTLHKISSFVDQQGGDLFFPLSDSETVHERRLFDCVRSLTLNSIFQYELSLEITPMHHVHESTTFWRLEKKLNFCASAKKISTNKATMRIFNYLLRTGIIIILCVGRFQSHVHSSVQYLTVSAKINDGNPATCAQRPSISKGSYQLLRGILGES